MQKIFLKTILLRKHILESKEIVERFDYIIKNQIRIFIDTVFIIRIEKIRIGFYSYFFHWKIAV